MTNKIWTADEIKNNILNNDVWAVRGLLAIYKYQTEMEKKAKETLIHNNVGFNGADGKMLSSLAQFYLNKNYLTDKQMYILRKRMLKYAGQLAKIANNML